jgi:hypothetical protein
MNLTLGAAIQLNSSNTLQVSQTIGSSKSLDGAADWFNSGFFTKRISFGAGISYSRAGPHFSTTERLLATVQLPFQQVLQFTYSQSPTGPLILAQLHGPLLRRHRAEIALGGPLAELNSYSAFYGKIYQDVNLDGHFDPGVDKPLANVQVRADGSFSAVTDANGDFRIENVKVGQHTVYLDLLTVRADLTLLNSSQQVAVLRPGRDLIVDFRLVRTGRIAGIVWLDQNGNGIRDEGEQPLPDVRVVTGSGRDTMTDAQGLFVIGDLSPGQHVVLIDEKTLPEKTKSAVASLQVEVKAGTETGDLSFPVIPRPPEVEVKRFPSIE